MTLVCNALICSAIYLLLLIFANFYCKSFGRFIVTHITLFNCDCSTDKIGIEIRAINRSLLYYSYLTIYDGWYFLSEWIVLLVEKAEEFSVEFGEYDLRRFFPIVSPFNFTEPIQEIYIQIFYYIKEKRSETLDSRGALRTPLLFDCFTIAL